MKDTSYMQGLLDRSALIGLSLFCASCLGCKHIDRADDLAVDSRLAQETTEHPDSPFKYFTPKHWSIYAEDLFIPTNGRAKINLFQVDPLDGVHVNADFRASIQGVNSGVYLRQETWNLSTDLGPGGLIQDLTEHLTTPLAIRLRAGREISYSRVYDTRQDALGAPLAKPSMLPLNSDRALKMNPGDFVSIPTFMGFALGLSASQSMEPFCVGTAIGAYWQGDVRLNIYALGNGFVRLKLAPSAEIGLSATGSLGAKLDMFGYSPGRLVNYDKQAERLLGLDLFTLMRKKVISGERFALDYTFKLTDPSAKIAFDAIVRKTLALKSGLSYSDPIHGKIFDSVIVGDLTPAEYLAKLDFEMPPSRRRVSKNFEGSDSYTGEFFGSHAGLRLFRSRAFRSLTVNKISTAHVQYPHLIAQVFESQHGAKSWISSLRSSQTATAISVFDTDRTFQSIKPRNINFQFSFNQNNLSSTELQEIRDVQEIILGSLVDRSKLKSMQSSMQSWKKFHSNIAVNISPDFMSSLARAIRLYGPRLEDEMTQIAARILRSYRNSRSTFEFFREYTDALGRGKSARLESVVIFPLLESLGRLALNTPEEATLKFLSLMNVHPAAEILVPAILLEIAGFIHVPITVDIYEHDTNGQISSYHWGEKFDIERTSVIEHALYSLTHFGYEPI